MYIHGIHSNPTVDSSICKNLTVIIFVWELMQIGIPNIYVQSGYWMILNQCNVYISVLNIFKNTENIQFNHGADNPICMHRNSIHNVRCTFWGRKREQILQTFALTFIQYIHARGSQRGGNKTARDYEKYSIFKPTYVIFHSWKTCALIMCKKLNPFEISPTYSPKYLTFSLLFKKKYRMVLWSI